MDRVITPEQKEKLLDKYREVYVSHGDEWWDFVYDDTRRDLQDAWGFSVGEMQFSGFACQGDGASFTGSVTDFALFFKKNFNDDAFPIIRKRVADGQLTLRVVRSSEHRYCHSNTVSVYIEYADFQHEAWQAAVAAFGGEGPDSFEIGCYSAWNKQLVEEVKEFEEQATTLLRGRMDKMYADLESEYDNLTSDETVWDWIENNLDLNKELCDDE